MSYKRMWLTCVSNHSQRRCYACGSLLLPQVSYLWFEGQYTHAPLNLCQPCGTDYEAALEEYARAV